jgi:predicted HTH transcriptional regulator
MSTTDDIVQILKSRDLASLKGLRENQWFDAKRAAGYNIAIASGRFEVAKDVSALANAEGGHILVGLTTIDLTDEQTEEVDGLDLLPSGAFNVVGLQGVLKEYLHPKIQGLEVFWVEDADGGGLGVGVIAVPTLPVDQRFVLMKQVLSEGEPVPQIVFGIAIRRGSNSVPLTVEQLHRMCQDGRSTVSERLTRIEAKLDALARAEETTISPPAFDPDVLEERLKRILGDG